MGKEMNIPIISQDFNFRIATIQMILTKSVKNFYKLLELNYRLVINSNNIYKTDYEIGIRRSGFLRPIGLFSCPLSIEISLEHPFNFDNNWKRNIKKSKEHKLFFEEIKLIDNTILVDIIKMFKEMAQFKKLSNRLEFNSLKILLDSESIRTFVVKDQSGNNLAARIIHDNGFYTTDIYAANTMNARKCGATYFIMESILTLKNEGKLLFDFGRIPPK